MQHQHSLAVHGFCSSELATDHLYTDELCSCLTAHKGGVVAEWLARSTRVRKDTGFESNPAEAGHYVTTVGKLFTPTVPSRAEGRLNQLAPGTAVPL